MTTYNYKKTKKGYYELESVKDVLKGDITYYKNNKQYETRNFNDVVMKTYKWQGDMLMYSENTLGKLVTWYDKGKPTYTTFRGELVNEWIYFKGKLLGVWDERANTLQLYAHGRKEMDLYFEEKPEAEDIIEMSKKYGFEM
jgi:hypothetical protein